MLNEHPFWLANRGQFVEAGQLQPGDQVTGPNGELQALVKTVHEPHPAGIPVYNFEVEGFHTYYVAAHGPRAPPVLVHNKGPKKPQPPPPTEPNLGDLFDDAIRQQDKAEIWDKFAEQMRDASDGYMRDVWDESVGQMADDLDEYLGRTIEPPDWLSRPRRPPSPGNN